MTVTTEAEVTLPAYLVEQGDTVWCESTQDWEYVHGVRHHHSDTVGWTVTLEIGVRDKIVCQPSSPIRLVKGQPQ